MPESEFGIREFDSKLYSEMERKPLILKERTKELVAKIEKYERDQKGFGRALLLFAKDIAENKNYDELAACALFSARPDERIIVKIAPERAHSHFLDFRASCVQQIFNRVLMSEEDYQNKGRTSRFTEKEREYYEQNQNQMLKALGEEFKRKAEEVKKKADEISKSLKGIKQDLEHLEEGYKFEFGIPDEEVRQQFDKFTGRIS